MNLIREKEKLYYFLKISFKLIYYLSIIKTMLYEIIQYMKVIKIYQKYKLIQLFISTLL